MLRLVTTLLIVPCTVALAQTPATTPSRVEREVKGQTIISDSLPAADLTFADDFHYVASQVINLYGVAEAEQHIFVAGPSGRIERFYWVQFEHYLPTNKHTYNYRPDRTTDISGLQFIYDVKAFTDYSADMQNGADAAAVAALLKRNNLAPPARVARVRMFHLPGADRRSELMIIYGEALPPQSPVSASAEGTPLDTEDPAAAKLVLQHALQGITIRRALRRSTPGTEPPHQRASRGASFAP